MKDLFKRPAGDAVPGDVVNAMGVVAEHAGSKDSASTRAWLDAHRHDPAIAFYLERNPHCAQG